MMAKIGMAGFVLACVGAMILIVVTGIRVVTTKSVTYACPTDMREHRAFVIECTKNSMKGVHSCTIDADQLFCTRIENE